MKEELKKKYQENKKQFVIFVILWFVLAIVFVAPFACTIVESTANGKFVIAAFLEQLPSNVTNIFGNLGKIWGEKYFSEFISLLGKCSFVYLILVVIAITKMKTKPEYQDIEHGSSDWSENGEQYKILSKKSGIILAEENYLPLDKRGNVNVLIVGRIRFW